MNTCQEISERQREDINIGNVPHVTVPQYGEREDAVSGQSDQENQQEDYRHDVSFRSIAVRRVLLFHVHLLLLLFRHHLVDHAADAGVTRGRGDTGSNPEDRRGGRGGPWERREGRNGGPGLEHDFAVLLADLCVVPCVSSWNLLSSHFARVFRWPTAAGGPQARPLSSPWMLELEKKDR